MIVPRRPSVRHLIFYTGRPLFLLILWDTLVVLAYRYMHWDWVAIKSIPLALYGSAIGIIVGFRNNSAYGRWWEARTLWGSIVNDSRSFARQVLTTLRPRTSPDLPVSHDAARDIAALQSSLIHHQIAWVHALRQQLRGLDSIHAIHAILPAGTLAELQSHSNVPLAIQRRMADMLRTARDHNWIDALEWQALDGTLDDLMNAQGGTERIKNTPLPKQYDFFPRLFVQIYCLLLPVGMVQDLGWFTPLGSTLVGFMFLALDKIGRDLEDPFDNTIYDVPLGAITNTIEINLRQLLGEKDVPAAASPIRNVLW